ncbi:alpha/beta fold hydrolase [Paenibacillus hodogayensis]|uniref:Alpha/beta fold hydrolase n=1 Tax=Paenibacillus hodogayensis TaxID=279208 RepID=A0ABV5VX21_9BACL
MRVVERGYVLVEGTKLYYESAGEGEAVVLMHGAFMTAGVWDATFETLSKQYRVVRYDWRGMGKSDLGITPYRSYDDLRSLLDALEIDRAHVVGLSAGGYVAVEFALAYPERVATLSLVAAGLFGLPESEPLQRDNALFYEAAQAGDMPAMLQAWTQMWLDGPMQPSDRVDEAVRRKFQELSRQSLSRFAEFEMPQMLVPAPIGRLGEIAVPTLVVAGEFDYPDAHAAAGRFMQDIPGARQEQLSDCAHIPPMDCPERFNELLGTFLGRATATALPSDPN